MMKARGRKKIAGKYWPFKTSGDWFPNTLWLVQHHSLQSLNPPDHKNTDYMKKDWTCSATQNTWKGSHTSQLPTGPITSTWKLNQLVASPGEGRSSSHLWITDTSLHIWTNWKTTNGLTIMHFYYKVKYQLNSDKKRSPPTLGTVARRQQTPSYAVVCRQTPLTVPDGPWRCPVWEIVCKQIQNLKILQKMNLYLSHLTINLNSHSVGSPPW